jgi:hypothetical protein
MSVAILAFAKGIFGLLALGDIDYGNGDPYYFASLVAGGLIRGEKCIELSRPAWPGSAKFHSGDCFTGECTA